MTVAGKSERTGRTEDMARGTAGRAVEGTAGYKYDYRREVGYGIAQRDGFERGMKPCSVKVGLLLLGGQIGRAHV